MHQSIFDLSTIYQLTLDNFVIGQNKEVVKAIREFRENPQTPYKGIYIFGSRGSGRTHLLKATLHDAQRGLYIDAQTNKMLKVDIEGFELIAVDNIDSLSPKGQITLFNWFNQITQKNLKLVLSGNKAPLFLSLREDLRTRVSMLLAFCLNPLHDEQKVEVVKKYAQEKGIILKENTILYLLNRVDRQLSNLIDWLNRLDQLSLSQKRNITAHFVKMAIESADCQDLLIKTQKPSTLNEND